MKKKIAMGRRKFLGFMAASPLAGKQAAEAAAEQLSFGSKGTLLGLDTPSDEPVQSLGRAVARNEKSLVRSLFNRLREGIPDFKIKEMKEQAKMVRQIDPSIAVLRSVSFIGKVQMQREKQFQKNKEHLLNRFDETINEEKEKFREEFGYWL